MSAQPVSLAAILAGAMSHIDGCLCGNSEPPRAAVPIEGGWRCSYLCSDCGRAWVTDYPEED